MGVRFRKSVKLFPGSRANFSKSGVSATFGGKGLSYNVGKHGVYMNMGIPGTGLYTRKRVLGGGSKKSSSTKRQPAKKAIKKTKYTVNIEMHSDFSVDLTIGGKPVTDPKILSQIKSSAEYKNEIARLREETKKENAEKLVEMNAATTNLTDIYIDTPTVNTEADFEQALKQLRPEVCALKRADDFREKAPKIERIEKKLMSEAKQAIKGFPWSVKKQRQAYVDERIDDAYKEAKDQWQKRLDAFLEEENRKVEQQNAEYQKEYEAVKQELNLAIEGNVDYIEDTAATWLQDSSLPVKTSAALEYRSSENTLMVDLDLPEIEDLPTETTVQLVNGTLKTKEKTQKQLREEYATCVFGLMVYLSANFFNVSPQVKEVVVSGYTQRRNKAGDVVDDYIVSIKFLREKFADVNFEHIDPEVFCNRFENRCIVSSTKVFKTIEPYA